MTANNRRPQIKSISLPELRKLIRLAQDAIDRAADNVAGVELPRTQCAYIDGQLARAITNLASARAIVINAGDLQPCDLDEVEAADLWERFELADAPADESGKGGVS